MAVAAINSLPDSILAKCLAELSQQDRVISAAPVCRRWRDACAAPELLREVTVAVAGQDLCSPLAALLRWLLRHGTAVHSLTFQLSMGAIHLNSAESFDDQAPGINALIDSCIAACSSLEHLFLAIVKEGPTSATPSAAGQRQHVP